MIGEIAVPFFIIQPSMYVLKLTAFAFLSLLISIYVALSPVFAMSIYKFLLFPAPRYPVGRYQGEMIPGHSHKEVFFRNSAGQRLHGRILRCADSCKWILYSHGNGANVSVLGGLSELFLDTGASVFLYDYRGYGRSEGIPSLEGICDDACDAFDYLVKAEKVKPGQILLYGESLGSAVSTHLAQQRECGGIILHGPYISIRKAAEDMYPLFRIYPTWLFPQPNLNTLDPLKTNHPPLLIVHGRKDNVIPVAHAEELYQKAKGPKQLLIVDDAAHWDAPFIAAGEFRYKVSKMLNQATSGAKGLIVSAERF